MADASDVLFAADTDNAGRRAFARRATRGELARLTAGVYTTEVGDPEAAVRRHLWKILAHEIPGAVITDRSVADGGIGSDGVLCVSVPNRSRSLRLPGMQILPRRGAGPVEGDMALPDGLWMAGEARALLDNLAPARATAAAGLTSRVLDRAAIEGRLDEICARRGPDGLNHVRDQARAIASALGRTRELKTLDALVGAALNTRAVEILLSPHLKARATGTPVDSRRIAVFERLAAALADLSPAPLAAMPVDGARRALLPFYEAYFSNFIEGTEFTVDEAAEIVFDGNVPTDRPADAHDIIGTYRLTSSIAEMSRVPSDGAEFVGLLKERHAVLLGGRPEVVPGQFKVRANRAGSTHFVAPDLVEGTLLRGFDVTAGLIDPFARAVFMMFLVSEVHPFSDGNGRIARIFMNAELVSADQVRIVIPTVYRENYLAGLRAATHTAGDANLIAVLEFARRWTARVDWSTRTTSEADFERTNALRAARDAEDAGVRLTLP
ncbi:MAG: Fic family protein [Sporichthyaceae bacterium]